MTGAEAVKGAEREPKAPKKKKSLLGWFEKKKSVQEPTISNQDLFEVQIVSNLVKSYFEIVRKHVADSIPKTIFHLFVKSVIYRQTKDQIHSWLVNRLYKDEVIEDLLAENRGIQESRTKCLEYMNSLKNAATALTAIINID